MRLSAEHQPSGDLEQWLYGLGLRLLIPMLVQNETRGLLCLGERLGADGYDAPEVEYLSALANITIAALENAKLVIELVGKREMERELTLARTIQKGLLPSALAQPAGYDIAAINESSQKVGGDYYDVIPLSEHEFVIAIGDVSGKGIPASLLMANVQAALRTMAPLRLPLPDATARLNALVFSNTQADKFITFFWGILDTRAHTLTYINAGHNPPYLVHADGSFVPLSTGGLILGILEEVPPYDEETVAILPGDTIVTYTDGVNEALSKDMEEFGNPRLEALLERLVQGTPSDLIQVVRENILEFTVGAKQSDDITMLVVKRG
ncbi:MAG: SpoIIE family protein phosphatase [Ignavibacteria bacterium]|nr:SpoIIE family protein phosphatase [Ignavibacteria bacterium]